jgi:spermidine synthase
MISETPRLRRRLSCSTHTWEVPMPKRFTARSSLFTALFIAALALPLLAQVQTEMIYDVKSQYQRITVVDRNGYRQMIFDAQWNNNDAIQSEMDKLDPTALTLSYSRHMMTSLPLVAKPQHILIVGLGGACIERFLYKLLPEANIQTVELDPEVLNIARKYFQLHEDARQVVTLGDGRRFMDETKDKYDLIMLDAFSATSIPYPLSTREFLEACKGHLNAGGIIVANLWYAEKDYPSMLKTYDAIFPEWHVVKCADSTNAILMAFPVKQGLTKEKWMQKLTEFDKTYKTGLDLPALLDKGLETETKIPADAKVLLDKDEPKGKE